MGEWTIKEAKAFIASVKNPNKRPEPESTTDPIPAGETGQPHYHDQAPTPERPHDHRDAPAAGMDPPVLLPIRPGAENIQVVHSDFRKLDIPAGSARLVLTDPPFQNEQIGLWADLGEFAAKVLSEGGVLLAYSGHHNLPQVFEALTKHLKYRWMLATVHGGESSLVHSARMKPGWTPLLLFSKGPYQTKEYVVDVIRGYGREKEYHPWQKPLGEIEHLVATFSKPGDLVVDPFGGSFTTALACKRLNRRFVGCDIEQQYVAAGLERLRAG